MSYQALTAFCRRHGIGHAPPKPVGHYHFEPGKEMQHDTSPHDAHIGGAVRRVQTASLVFAHSRMVFMQLYPRFTRFHCKVFLTEALQYFGGACADCMIDNTHVVVLRGTGKEMVPVPEMEAFGRRFGFQFIAHAKGDANRSAHVERQFDHIERNFLAGRQFTDFADANRHARAWCDKVNASFKRHLHARPRELFAVERPHLRALPTWIPEVYALHQRIIDLEGYVHVDGHMYSVPYQLIGKSVEVRETKDKIRVFVGPREVAVHTVRAATGGRQRTTLPEHRPPRGQVAASLRSPDEDELALAGPPFAEFAAMLRKRSPRWPVALRRLAQLRRDYPAAPLVTAIESAMHYGLYDLDRLERMILRNVATAYFIVPVDRNDPTAEVADEG
ncbi:MAG: transposase [Deltaproteobacteria bacterium]|nr:transposase [Deltaproteobacteria bacterium]